jgi:hypothetical protein
MMPRYLIEAKDKLGKQRLHNYTADSPGQAAEMAMGDGFEVISVAEDLPPQIPSGRPYDLLGTVAMLITVFGFLVLFVGMVAGGITCAVHDGGVGSLTFVSAVLSGLMLVGMGQTMRAVRDIAINTTPTHEKGDRK